MFDIFQGAVTNTLRVMASGLRIPVMVLLILLAATTLFLLGTLIVEIFMEHRHLKEEMPPMVDKIESAEKDKLDECILTSLLLQRQKDALLELTKHPDLTPLMRESLAIRLIAQEKDFYDGRTRRTDLIARLGPMLGLMGTLIPLGPGVIALGQGDTYTLSTSLLMAFDTTVAGLACAAVALVISNVRKRWYKNYMSMTETLMECTLEALNRPQEDETAVIPPTVKANSEYAPSVPAEDAGKNDYAPPAGQNMTAEQRREQVVEVYKKAFERAVQQGQEKEKAAGIAKREAENFLRGGYR